MSEHVLSPRARRRIATRRGIGAAVAVVVLAWITASLLSNENLELDLVGHYLFAPEIMIGLGVTIQLTLASGAIALAVGVVLVLVSRWGRIGEAVVAGYVWLFRSVPLLVQLLVWFNLAILIPRVQVGLPDGPFLIDISTNDLITGFAASLLGLALHESAYFAEILRGGLMAVPQGQYRAAAAAGMTGYQAYRHIIGPQALRVAVPALSNQMVGLLKATSMVAVIGGGELLTRAQWIYAQNFKVIPLLIVVTIWYLVLVGIATLVQKLLERRMLVREKAPVDEAAVRSLAQKGIDA
jgi:polar amino acid transport system permease protein